jgi:hypothetical protein
MAKSKCHCTGRSGVKKRLYKTRQAAVTMAIRRGWPPHTYRCPTANGYHLTHD